MWDLNSAALDVTKGKSFCDKPQASESHGKGRQFGRGFPLSWELASGGDGASCPPNGELSDLGFWELGHRDPFLTTLNIFSLASW